VAIGYFIDHWIDARPVSSVWASGGPLRRNAIGDIGSSAKNGVIETQHIPMSFKEEAECSRMEKALKNVRRGKKIVPTSRRRNELSAEN